MVFSPGGFSHCVAHCDTVYVVDVRRTLVMTTSPKVASMRLPWTKAFLNNSQLFYNTVNRKFGFI